MTILTRRTVIGAAAAGVVAGIVGTTPEASAARRRRRPPKRRHRKPKVTKAAPHLYSRSRFARFRRTTFTVVGPAGSTPMVLTAVTDWSRARAGADSCFGLTFTCTKSGPPQGSYTFRRPGFAPTPLFVVPSDADRHTYQAVVYRG